MIAMVMLGPIGLIAVAKSAAEGARIIKPFKCLYCKKFFPSEMKHCPHCGDKTSKLHRDMMTATDNPCDVKKGRNNAKSKNSPK